ncbi:MAG: hypothetical protein JNL88_13540 [Bacteroidia bacterium]|nr:hypothetical protein [Bacteroidia bacterium]
MLLELACFHPDSVRIAATVGVHRLELCEEYTCGGLSPSPDFFHAARRAFPNDIFVMIRPRPGNFIYTEAEFSAMLRAADAYKRAGANGFVSGFFDAGGNIHRDQLRRFVEACHPLPLTFHRSFDQLSDWSHGLDLLIDVGCRRLLSSGMASSAHAGRFRLKEMMEYAGEQLLILPGGGIRASNVGDLVHTCHPAEIHSAAILPESLTEGKFTADESELRALLMHSVSKGF